MRVGCGIRTNMQRNSLFEPFSPAGMPALPVQSRQNLGLFGGSFDPVHVGHLLVAQAAREELDLNRLFFIPAAQSPFKPERPPTPAQERLRLLRLALAGKE